MTHPFEKAPGLFYLWGHSYEFDWNMPDNHWGIIECFAEYMGNRQEIWYATNIEICDYAAAYRHLIFSTDGSKVYNPTATELFFETPYGLHRVASGAMLRLG